MSRASVVRILIFVQAGEWQPLRFSLRVRNRVARLTPLGRRAHSSVEALWGRGGGSEYGRDTGYLGGGELMRYGTFKSDKTGVHVGIYTG